MRKISSEKNSNMEAEVMPSMMPHFGIGTEHLPEAKKWEVGKTYDVTIRVKQTGISMHKGEDNKEHGRADFEIVGIQPHGEVKAARRRYTK